MYKILVVDDEPKIAELLKVCLEMQGMEVSCAENGREALEIFAKSPADMILTDIMMPVMDGYELVSELRRKSNVPVMFLTAKGDILDRIKGLNVGADDYLVKPFDPMEAADGRGTGVSCCEKRRKSGSWSSSCTWYCGI